MPDDSVRGGFKISLETAGIRYGILNARVWRLARFPCLEFESSVIVRVILGLGFC